MEQSGNRLQAWSCALPRGLAHAFFLNLFLKHVTVNLIVNLIGLRTTHKKCTPLHVAVLTFSDADWVRFAPNVSGTRAKQERERRKAACVGIPAALLCVCGCERAPTG